jgi:hypothetical protein
LWGLKSSTSFPKVKPLAGEQSVGERLSRFRCGSTATNATSALGRPRGKWERRRGNNCAGLSLKARSRCRAYARDRRVIDLSSVKRILPLMIVVVLAVGYVAMPIVRILRRKPYHELIGGRIEPGIEDGAMAHFLGANFPWPPTIYDDVLPSSRTVWGFEEDEQNDSVEPTADDEQGAPTTLSDGFRCPNSGIAFVCGPEVGECKRTMEDLRACERALDQTDPPRPAVGGHLAAPEGK